MSLGALVGVAVISYRATNPACKPQEDQPDLFPDRVFGTGRLRGLLAALLVLAVLHTCISFQRHLSLGCCSELLINRSDITTTNISIHSVINIYRIVISI